MRVLSIRGAADASYAAWKKAAIDSGQTLKGWVIEALDAAVASSAGKLEEDGSTVEGDSKSAKEILSEAQARLEERKKSIPSMRPPHDAKACRLYGCLQCKALGVQDPKKGV